MEVISMPIVEISVGQGAFSPEERTNLGKAINEKVIEYYQKTKGSKPHVWVIVREEPPDNWIIEGESLTEYRKRMQQQK
jgi:phenylpyruvate tautomerase PptA (4-oxalocrotonate tautomerase family)